MKQHDLDIPEITETTLQEVHCDGRANLPPALGHPRIFLRMNKDGFVECPYCDRRFVLKS